MFSVNIKENIQERYFTFSDKEKRIATFLLVKETQRIANLNVSQLSKATNTTPAIVIRFVSKLGLRSFAELKLQISSQDKADRSPQKAAQKNTIQDEVSDYYSSLVKNTENMTADADLKKVMKLILKTPRIYLYGVGSSGQTATEFGQRMLQMGLSASAIVDTHMMIANSLAIRKNDLVIGISSSGETREVWNALRIAKKNQARIVIFTGASNSSIAKLADARLDAYNSRFVGDARFVNSQLAVLYQIDVLSAMLLEDAELRKQMNLTNMAIETSLEQGGSTVEPE
ncbi:MurR/RpiR family transcriptional regulator [Lapidilactobacillus luobeiensis]|uniref:MurR/RpiR family transcriptional regulator n=1 Tax=Lapidilactobacillus luobeiensis TaxID=2950371 RepID=UPI0021C42945|nr:MurR/RpiR family transcriptional regulator [Lapidilactobacillus luobeiensis]